MSFQRTETWEERWVKSQQSPWTRYAQVVEMTDRYEALGMPHPDPNTMCPGQCEGTGFVPVDSPDGSDGASAIDRDPELDRAWYVAEDKEPSDDGWHFVSCPECSGSGLREGKLVQRQGKWCALSEEGKSFGCYATKDEAKKRLQQMEMFKNLKGMRTVSYKATHCPHGSIRVRARFVQGENWNRNVGTPSPFAASPDELVPDSGSNRQEAPSEREGELDKQITLVIDEVKSAPKKKKRKTVEKNLITSCWRCKRHFAQRIAIPQILTNNPEYSVAGVCPTCLSLVGSIADHEDDFRPGGPNSYYVNAHPHCKCTWEWM